MGIKKDMFILRAAESPFYASHRLRFLITIDVVAFGLNQGVNLAIVAVSDDLGVGGTPLIECADHFGLAAPAAPLRKVRVPGKPAVGVLITAVLFCAVCQYMHDVVAGHIPLVVKSDIQFDFVARITVMIWWCNSDYRALGVDI
jgi:hypothetical protein